MRKPMQSNGSMAFVGALGLCVLQLPVPGRTEPPTDDWDGRWQGGLRQELEWSVAYVDFLVSDGHVVGLLDAPALGLDDALIELGTNEHGIQLTFESPDLGPLEIVAELVDGAIRSRPGLDWDAPAIHLVRTSPLDRQELDDYVGWYEADSGMEMLVTHGSEAGLRIFAGGSAWTLLPIAHDRFDVLFEETQPSPPAMVVGFTRDEARAVEGLESRDREVSTTARRLRDHRFATEGVELQSGELGLAGLVLRPAADAPVPAVVFVGGTGYSTADRLYEMALASRLLEQGILVLLLDKRGCGSSDGDWRSSSLADLADDTIAAVRFLDGDETVDGNAIGLWGVSEGGWVAALAASKCPTLAYIINQGGPAVSSTRRRARRSRRRNRVGRIRGCRPGGRAVARGRAGRLLPLAGSSPGVRCGTRRREAPTVVVELPGAHPAVRGRLARAVVAQAAVRLRRDVEGTATPGARPDRRRGYDHGPP
jgi:pimeloyl-ACP methyl ester carboxylesterase